MTSRKPPSAAFWATVAVVVGLLAYPLSFGPACWISSRLNAGAETVSIVYRPLTWGMSHSERAFNAMSCYSGFGAAKGWAWNYGEYWHWGESSSFARWLYSPEARAINRSLGVDQ